MKTYMYQVQYMSPDDSSLDGFIKVRAISENEAIAKTEKLHPDWIVLDAYKL